MHVFTIIYLIGIILGIGIYALLSLFTKEFNKKVILLFSFSFLILVISVFIGGFESMPFGILSGGIITTATLLIILGRKEAWRKGLFTALIIMVVSLITFSILNKTDYWVIKKNQLHAQDEISVYYNKLQSNPSINGYKIMNNSEGTKAVILSLGEERQGTSLSIKRR